MDDAEKLFQLLKQLQSFFGIGVLFIIIVLVAALYFYWKFLLKK